MRAGGPGSLKSSARMEIVSTKSPAKCDEMGARGYRRCRKKRLEGACKKLTMRSIKTGQRPMTGLQRKC